MALLAAFGLLLAWALATSAGVASATAATNKTYNQCNSTSWPGGTNHAVWMAYPGAAFDLVPCGYYRSGIATIKTSYPMRLKRYGQSGNVCYNPGTFGFSQGTVSNVWTVSHC